jgi:hypothetical protein
MRKAVLALALAPLVAGPAVGALAATGGVSPTTTGTSTTTTPAPDANTSADALKVDGVISAGHSDAHATSSSASAHADALSVGGKTLVPGKTGGSQTSDGSSSGALIDTGTTPLGQLQVTPWSASAHHSATSSNSASDAALAHAVLIDDKMLSIYLLHSRSEAAWTQDQSTSSSSSDGAEVNAGNGALDLKVLHSEASSNGSSKSALVSVNGNDIGSSDQANGQCVLAIPQVAKLTCLDASGGKGSGSSSADGGTLTVGNGDTPQGVLTGVQSTGSKTSGASTTGDTVEARHDSRTPHVEARSYKRSGEPAATSAATGSLPFTGMNGLIAVYGAALVALGTAIARVGRRRSPQLG